MMRKACVFELLENGRRTSFVYHDGELLQEEGREEQGTSYHLGAGMEAFRRGQELSYYHRDEQLSTVFVTDGQGEIRNSYQYDAFGIPLETTEQLNNRIRYTGQQYDELTEQYYLRARYYNPVAGRFMQEDVYQGDGLNLYAYCGNNPVMYDDPSGYASTSTGKACPPQGKISESVDETSYGKSSSNCTELVPYYPANNGAESGSKSGSGSKFQEVFDLADNYTLSDDTFDNHILDRHGPNSTYGNKSHFNADFDIRNSIDSTLTGDNFIVGPNTAGREGYIFEQTFSNPIGTNSKGKPLYTLKVVIDEAGNVITAFPKK